MTAPRLIITVDTELSNFPDGQGLWGRIGSQEWGVTRLVSVFDSCAVRATFFVDVYGVAPHDVAEQRRAAECAAAAGHDVQLHTHPGPAFDPSRPMLRDYSSDEQRDIIAFGTERLAAWLGTRPTVHRAGDWAADEASYDALARCGYRADFSACAWSSNCGVRELGLAGNGWTRMGDLLCAVGTGYRDRLTGRVRRVDLGGASLRENLDILALRIDPLILTLHSFSLMRFNKARTRFEGDPGYVERLQQFCAAARDAGYEMRTAKEATEEMAERGAAPLPWVELPVTSATASCAGILRSVRNRLALAA